MSSGMTHSHACPVKPSVLMHVSPSLTTKAAFENPELKRLGEIASARWTCTCVWVL